MITTPSKSSTLTGGGELKVQSQKLEWKVTSRIGSLANVKHKPGGGAIKIFDEKYARGRSASEARSPNQLRSPSPVDSLDNGTSGKNTPASRKSASNTPLPGPAATNGQKHPLPATRSTPTASTAVIVNVNVNGKENKLPTASVPRPTAAPPVVPLKPTTIAPPRSIFNN